MTNKAAIRPERLAFIKSQVQFGAKIDPKAGAELIDEIERLRALLDAPAAPPVVVGTVRHVKTENSERYEGVIRASAIIEGLVAEGTQLCVAPTNE